MLADAEIPFYIHAGPYLPYLTDPEIIVEKFHRICGRFDFENLNLKMMSKANLFAIIEKSFSGLMPKYDQIYKNPEKFVSFWTKKRELLNSLKTKYKCEINVYFHRYDSYFPIKNI